MPCRRITPPAWAVRVLDNQTGAAGCDGPDGLELIVVDDSVRATLMQDAVGPASTLLVDQAQGLKAGAYLALSDFQQAVLYRLTADPKPQVLSGNSGPIAVQALTVTAPPVAPSFALSAGLMASLARPIRYTINSTLLGGTPALVLQDGAPLDTTQALQLVADNVEDLQIALGIDGLLTGVADGQLSEVALAPNDDEWVYNVAGDTLPLALPQGAVVSALRITVTGRTRVAGDAPTSGRLAAENRPAGAPDGYRRRVMTTMIGLRSLLSQSRAASRDTSMERPMPKERMDILKTGPRAAPRAARGRGVALLLTLSVMSGLLLAGFVALEMRVATLRQVGESLRGKEAFYCAEAGLAAGRDFFRKNAGQWNSYLRSNYQLTGQASQVTGTRFDYFGPDPRQRR